MARGASRRLPDRLGGEPPAAARGPLSGITAATNLAFRVAIAALDAYGAPPIIELSYSSLYVLQLARFRQQRLSSRQLLCKKNNQLRVQIYELRNCVKHDANLDPFHENSV